MKTKKASRIILVALFFLFGALLIIKIWGSAAGKIELPKIVNKKERPRCPLEGTEGTSGTVARRPLAIMIENSTASRPQSGLDKACLVYEIVAEGGITRFLAVYLHDDAEVVGPVRSTREYYVSLAKGMNAMLAHAGGSPGAYDKIRSLGVDSLDQFANGDSYWRARDRRAPHNLYTATKNLRELQAKKNLSTAGLPRAITFKNDVPKKERPSKARVNLDFAGKNYKVYYDYDPAGNDYLRYMADMPHRDGRTSAQMKAKNIIVMFTDINQDTSAGKGRMAVKLTGSGSAMFFQDGKSFSGSWERNSESDLFTYRTTEGVELRLNRGTTWVEIMPNPEMVSHRESTQSYKSP